MTASLYRFLEERRPTGTTGLEFIRVGAPFDTRAPDLADCLVARPKPWILVIWEPLRTKAPCPALAQPWCCYANTVIFYHRPFILRPWQKRYRDGRGRLRACDASYEEFDRTETRLVWNDTVAFGGDEFEVQGGHVCWADRRWWICRVAARRDARRIAA